MKGENIKERTEAFAEMVLDMAGRLPKGYTSQVIFQQVVRSATSAAANYNAACRSKSRRDFVNKLKIGEVELDETRYWLGLVKKKKYFPENRILSLPGESNELLAIIVKSITTAKINGRKKSRNEMK